MHRGMRALGWTAGVLLIALAVLVALAQVLLPLLARHPQWVAAQLSERLQRPVSFASMQGQWTPSGPSFALHGVSIGGTGGIAPLTIPEAQLGLDFGGWLLPSRHLFNVHAQGLRVGIVHAADGRWHVSGIGASGGDGQNMSMPRLSVDLWLDQLQVDVGDEASGRHYPLVADQLRVSLGSGRARLGARLRRVDTPGVLVAAGTFREDGATGRIWLAGQALDVKAMLGDVPLGGYSAESGHGELAVWFDWRQGKVTRSLVQADLTGLSIAGPQGGRAQVTALQGVADLRESDDGYQVRWAGADGSALAMALHQPATAQATVGVAARDLRLAPLLPWLALKPELSPALAQWIGAGRPRGSLDQAALQWSRAAGIQSLSIDFSGLGIDPVGKLPGVDQLHGSLSGDPEALSLSLPDQATVLRFPHLFRQPFEMSRLGGTLAFWHEDLAWHIGVDPLDCTGQGFDGQARGEVALPDGGGAPFLDLYASVDHGDITAAKLFWPITSMAPSAIAWLDRALVGGQIDSGSVLVRGDLHDWPFRHNEGRFEAQAAISHLNLDYGKDWPRVDDLAATASFTDNGMLVQASGGRSQGLRLGKAVALIPDFADSVLDLNVQGDGNGKSLLDFVRTTPIARNQNDVLSKMMLGGSGVFDFHLSMPLKKIEDLQLHGHAQLKDADLAAADWQLQLDKLNGPLVFDSHGMHAGPLDVGLHGEPAKLDLSVAAATGDPDKALSASVTGAFSVAELLRDQPMLKWIGDAAEGRAPFVIGFDIAKLGGSSTYSQTLRVDSSLNGIALKLPAPLDKSAATDLPLHTTMGLPVSGSQLQVALGDALRGRFQLPSSDNKQPLAATLSVDGQMPDKLPAQGIRIRGHAAQLDVTGWVQQTAASRGGDGPALESIDIRADHALVFGRDFPQMRLQAAPQADGLTIDADSTALAGHFLVPRDLAKSGVTARMQRLYWPKDAPSPTDNKTAAKLSPPAASAADRMPVNTVPATNPAATGIDPAALPPFHLVIDDLRLGEAKLGQARMESWPVAKGMHIDQLRALSRGVQITAGGDWLGTASDSSTHLRVDFSAESLGGLLKALGFDNLFDGGRTRARIDASWPGAPSSMTLPNMDGRLSVDISDGRIPDVPAPGVGRLLGLISVSELPRRLGLDFGDVFGKGLGFDSIKGDFVLANGNATTNNLKIHGSAGQISITGRTGLRARDYDQQIVVIPHIGNSLPVVGAVVAGPVGAAAGFAMQGLLGKGFNKAASFRYKMTGSWDKPVMTEVGKSAAVPRLSDQLPAPSASTGVPAPAATAPTSKPAPPAAAAH
jgi:uncharacterized protein (TIGR02099 family)